MAHMDAFINLKKASLLVLQGGGGGALFKKIYKCQIFFVLLMMFQTLTGHYSSDYSITIPLYFF